MSFLNTIKNALRDERYTRASRGHTLVDTKSLIELVDHFERIESGNRLEYSKDHIKTDPEKVLADALILCYQSEKDEGKLFLFIMDILKPLINDRIKTDIAKG